MADGNYPTMPVRTWRALRAKAVLAPTGKFTPQSVAALVGTSNPVSARKDAVRPMKSLGLIDDDGALTPLGKRWRADSSFAEACQEILDNVYPQELGTLTTDDGEPDATKVKAWFEHQGFGESNAAKKTATYMMIAEKQIPEPSGSATTVHSAKSPKTPSDAGGPDATPTDEFNPDVHSERSVGTRQDMPSNHQSTPALHLDIQIHIPVDATPEQIDHIFASMSRHLYSR